MSNFETVKLLINEMSGTGENSLAVSKSVLEFMGDLEGGVFLSQVIYFSDKSKRTDGYFYKTYDEWKEHTFMTEYSIRKNVKILKEKGYLETSIKKANGSPTVHYKFDMERFSSDFIWFLRNRRNDSLKSQNGNCENADSLTKITTEITTNINNMSENGFSNDSAHKKIPSEKSESKSLLEQQFDEWWNLYDNKTKKVASRTLFKKAVKQYGYEQLKSDTEFYVSKFKTDKTYQKNPDTFLKNYDPEDKMFQQQGYNSYNNYNTSNQQQATQYDAVSIDNLFEDA